MSKKQTKLKNPIIVSEICKRLKQKGFISRQNGQDRPYFVNLGGPNTEINRDDFRGIILLNPSEGLIFGAKPLDLLKFRGLTMTHQRSNKWKLKKDIPGDSPHRVEVRVDASKSRMYCKIKSASIYIEVDGKIKSAFFDMRDGNWLCDSEVVEGFTSHFPAIERQ